MHTKEPWCVKKNRLDVTIVEGDDPDIQCPYVEIVEFSSNDEIDTEHAERIVACVNACAGISNESLDAGVLDGLADNLNKQKEAIAKLGDG